MNKQAENEEADLIAPDYDDGLLRTAVIIPCCNEGAAIGKVVRDCKKYMPSAVVYVYDNNSTDDTVVEAQRAGAVIGSEKRQGKGFVVRRMFADIDADVYVMIDGDDTYDPSAIQELVNLLVRDNLDMVNAARSAEHVSAYRTGHKTGNRMLTGLVKLIFGDEFDDMLSGYRVFSRRFVKSFPQSSGGFEIETELTIHALELQMPTAEISTSFRDRAEGTESKLRTFYDGFRILRTITNLLKQERPLRTFSVVGTILVFTAVALAYPLLITYIETGLVPRFPTAILATGITLLGFLSYTCGLILDTVTRGRQEAKRMRYLAVPSIRSLLDQSDGGVTVDRKIA